MAHGEDSPVYPLRACLEQQATYLFPKREILFPLGVLVLGVGWARRFFRMMINLLNFHIFGWVRLTTNPCFPLATLADLFGLESSLAILTSVALVPAFPWSYPPICYRSW